MRILFVTPTLGLGGSELLTIMYARAARELGHEAVVAYGFDDRRLPEVSAAGISAVRLSRRLLAGHTMPEYVIALRRAAASFRPDVIHAQSVKSAVTSAFAAPGVPLLATIHGIKSEEEWLAALCLRAARARVTAVSEAAAAGVRRHRIAPPVDLLPPGIDLGALADAATGPATGATTGRPHFCCAARQHPAKGVDVLVRAFAEVHEKLPSATLTLVGSGEDSAVIDALISGLGLSDVVSQIGAVGNAAPYLRAADIVVLPSRREGLPLVVLEALGLSRPVIATAVGGTPSVIRDGENGWLVPPEDPPALAAAMLEAATDPARARRLAEAGHALVSSSFSNASVVERLRLLLDEVVQPGERPLRRTGGTWAGRNPQAVSPLLKPRAWYVAGARYDRVRLATAPRHGAAPATGVRILAYHRVSGDDDVLSVTPAAFRAQMRAVIDSGARVVRLSEALDRLTAPTRDYYICVTFDDGYLDLLQHAAPILHDLGIPATVFLPTAVIDGTATFTWYRRNPPAALSWRDVDELLAGGLVDCQSHSRSHPRLPALSDEEARAEFTDSKADLERHVPYPVSVFCYPEGLYGGREVDLLHRSGYRAAVTTRSGINHGETSRLGELRRTMISHYDDLHMVSAKLAGAMDEPAAIREWLRKRRVQRAKASP